MNTLNDSKSLTLTFSSDSTFAKTKEPLIVLTSLRRASQEAVTLLLAVTVARNSVKDCIFFWESLHFTGRQYGTGTVVMSKCDSSVRASSIVSSMCWTATSTV